MLGYGPTASASSTVSSPRATPTPMRWIAPSGAPNGCSRDSRCRDMPDSTRVPLIGLSPHGQQALFGLAAFRGLGEAERRDVAGLLREIAVGKGETVYRAGEDADALYIVASGAVGVLDGKQLIARYGPGEVFGESVLIAGERRLVTTCVALDAILLVLPRDSLARILERHPALHERLSSGLVRRVKEAVKLALAAPRARPSEIVVLQGWTSGEERRAFVESLADALEHELGRAVAIVTVASRARSSSVAARRDRPDAVVLGEPSHRGEVRDRLAAELATRGAQAPMPPCGTSEHPSRARKRRRVGTRTLRRARRARARGDSRRRDRRREHGSNRRRALRARVLPPAARGDRNHGPGHPRYHADPAAVALPGRGLQRDATGALRGRAFPADPRGARARPRAQLRGSPHPVPRDRDRHTHRRPRRARRRRPERCHARQLLGPMDLLAVPRRRARPDRRGYERPRAGRDGAQHGSGSRDRRERRAGALPARPR